MGEGWLQIHRKLLSSFKGTQITWAGNPLFVVPGLITLGAILTISSTTLYGILVGQEFLNLSHMPDKSTIKKSEKDKAEGKSPSTHAGEFVYDEIKKIRKGEHGARNVKQAIAIGLSEARRAGVDLPPPKTGGKKLRKKAKRDTEMGKRHEPVNPKRSRARIKSLKKEPTTTVSHEELSKQARQAARRRSKADRSAAAKKAAKTKGPRKRRLAAKKAARTRARS